MKFCIGALVSAVWLLAAPLAGAETVKVGVVPNVYAQSIEALIPEAKAQGLDIQIVEFSDWTTPNLALQSGDIDVNYFQHKPFLDNATKQAGYDFGVAGLGMLTNIGLYSLKHKDFQSIPDGGAVAVANDPVNQGRGLLLLQRAGLIKLKDGVGFKGTLDDIVENPKTPEVLGSRRSAARARDARRGPCDGLSELHRDLEGLRSGLGASLFRRLTTSNSLSLFVVQKKKVDDPAIKKLVALYQKSDAVKAAIAKGFGDNSKLYALPWLDDGH